MRFKGYIGKRPYALWLIENIHSFVDPYVLPSQQFTIEETHLLIAKVVNVARMVNDSKSTFLNLTLQGHEFTGDFHLLQI
jgi:hypothetical protein